MSVISKQLAHDIANALTDKSRNVVALKRKEYEELVWKFYTAQTPAEVKKAFKLHPDWFHTRSEVIFNGKGFDWQRVYVKSPVICNSVGGREAHLSLTNDIADELMDAFRRWEKSVKEYNALKNETEQTLINLKTYKNIKENLPEAAKYFPPPVSNMLVVNVDPLRKKLAHQPEVKKEKTAK